MTQSNIALGNENTTTPLVVPECGVTVNVNIRKEKVLKLLETALGDCYSVSVLSGECGNEAAVVEVPVVEVPVGEAAVINPEMGWGEPFAVVEAETFKSDIITPKLAARAFSTDFTGLENNPGTVFGAVNNKSEPRYAIMGYFGEAGGFHVEVVSGGYAGPGVAQNPTDLGHDAFTFDGKTMVGDGTLILWIEPNPQGFASDIRLIWQGKEIQPTSKSFEGSHTRFINKETEVAGGLNFHIHNLAGSNSSFARQATISSPATYTTASSMRYYVNVAWPQA